MKAYIGRLENADWQTLIHGETRAKAKYNFSRWSPECEPEQWVDIRLDRLPAWDDRAFVDCDETRELFRPAGYHDPDGTPFYDSFYNDCRCELCKEKK